jgi:hypothetical protein
MLIKYLLSLAMLLVQVSFVCPKGAEVLEPAKKNEKQIVIDDFDDEEDEIAKCKAKKSGVGLLVAATLIAGGCIGLPIYLISKFNSGNKADWRGSESWVMDPAVLDFETLKKTVNNILFYHLQPLVQQHLQLSFYEGHPGGSDSGHILEKAKEMGIDGNYLEIKWEDLNNIDRLACYCGFEVTIPLECEGKRYNRGTPWVKDIIPTMLRAVGKDPSECKFDNQLDSNVKIKLDSPVINVSTVGYFSDAGAVDFKNKYVKWLKNVYIAAIYGARLLNKKTVFLSLPARIQTLVYCADQLNIPEFRIPFDVINSVLNAAELRGTIAASGLDVYFVCDTNDYSFANAQIVLAQ